MRKNCIQFATNDGDRYDAGGVKVDARKCWQFVLQSAAQGRNALRPKPFRRRPGTRFPL